MNAVLPGGKTGVDGDPLNPRLQIPLVFFGVGHENPALSPEAPEQRQVPFGDETVHNPRRQFIEFQKYHTRLRTHGILQS
jgi:hypothetical protein